MRKGQKLTTHVVIKVDGVLTPYEDLSDEQKERISDNILIRLGDGLMEPRGYTRVGGLKQSV